MLLHASFNGGNPVLGLILLPFFFAGPFVLFWLEVRAFLKSEAQSVLALSLLAVLGVLACYYGFAALREIHQTTGFLKFHMLVACVGGAAFPFVFGWEACKRGWLSHWTKPAKKKRRRREDCE